MQEKKKARRKALETYLSGQKNPGSEGETWEEPRKGLRKKDREGIEALEVPTSTKGLKVRRRKKGVRTPRQTFRCDESLWRQFQKVCRRKESKSASEILRRFIYNYTHGK